MIKQHGLDPIIQPSDVSETLPFPMEPQIAVMYLALKKALHAGNQRKVIAQANPEHPLLCREKGEPSHILAAVPLVVFDDKIIGKPKSREEAFQTLSMLRKNPHHVITGVCVTIFKQAAKPVFMTQARCTSQTTAMKSSRLTSIRGNHMTRPAAMPSREHSGNTWITSKATGITS